MKKHEKVKQSVIRIMQSYDRFANTYEALSVQEDRRRKRALHLLSYCKIKAKDRHELINMIKSPDAENLTVAEAIILIKVDERKA